MAKNKGTHGKGKTAVEEPDEFVQRVSSLSDTLQPHLKKIIAAICLLVAGLGAWEFTKWRHSEKAKSATAAYVAALKVVDAKIVSEDEAQPEDAPVPVVTFGSEEERRNASLQALAAVSSKHSDVKLSKLVLPREAKLLLSAGKYDEALAAYKKFAATSDVPETLRMAALEGVGYALEAKAMANEDATARQSGLEAALGAFAELQPSEGGPMRDYSLYHQGRLLVAMGKPDEGVAKFRQLLTEVPDSSLTTVVEDRLDSLVVGE